MTRSNMTIIKIMIGFILGIMCTWALTGCTAGEVNSFHTTVPEEVERLPEVSRTEVEESRLWDLSNQDAEAYRAMQAVENGYEFQNLILLRAKDSNGNSIFISEDGLETYITSQTKAAEILGITVSDMDKSLYFMVGTYQFEELGIPAEFMPPSGVSQIFTGIYIKVNNVRVGQYSDLTGVEITDYNGEAKIGLYIGDNDPVKRDSYLGYNESVVMNWQSITVFWNSKTPVRGDSFHTAVVRYLSTSIVDWQNIVNEINK